MSGKLLRIPCLIGVLALVAVMGSATAQTPRERIRVANSTTVHSLLQEAAGDFARRTGLPTPIVEPVGTRGSLTLFCGGVGTLHADIAVASRGLRPNERAQCEANGVSDILDTALGYDAQAVAIPGLELGAGPGFAPSREQIWLALAASVPMDSAVVANPYRNWSDIAPDLPRWPIRIIGPSQRSGQYDSLKTLFFEASCARHEFFAKANEADRRAACDTVAADGRYIEVTQLARDIGPRLIEEGGTAVGIVQFNELLRYAGKIQPVAISGVLPSPEAIADGSYSLSRTFRMQIKRGNLQVVRGIKEFAAYLLSDDAEAAFARAGIVPLPAALRQRAIQEIGALQ